LLAYCSRAFMPSQISRSNRGTARAPISRAKREVAILKGTAMVYSCCVVGCTNRGNTNSEGEKLSYHRFPVVIESQGDKTRELSSRRRLAWIASLKRKGWEPSEYSRVCSDHFVTGISMNLYGIKLCRYTFAM